MEVKYDGVTHRGSDYVSPDGELALSINLVNETGMLRVIGDGTVIMTLPEGYSLLGRHHRPGYTHWVLSWSSGDNTAVGWVDADDVEPGAQLTADQITQIGEWGAVNGFNTIGNTLLVLTDDGTYYFLWESDESNYTDLGNHIPEVPIRFGLIGNRYSAPKFDLVEGLEDKSKLAGRLRDGKLTDEDKTLLTNVLLGYVNKFVQENSVEKGMHMMPFYVRTAYRLYDGSLTMHSAPVLMVTCTGATPQVIDHPENHDPQQERHMFLTACFWKLAYGFEEAALEQAKILREKWKDIVTSIDVFITPPIYSYDQSGTLNRLWAADQNRFNGYSEGLLLTNELWPQPEDSSAPQLLVYYKKAYSADEEINIEKWPLKHATRGFYPNGCKVDDDWVPSSSEWPIMNQFIRNTITNNWLFYSNNEYYWGLYVDLPLRDKESVLEDIRNAGTFYLYHTFPVEEVGLTGGTFEETDFSNGISLEDRNGKAGVLKSLTAREQMTDDYDSHDKLIAKNSYVYNARVNLCGLQKLLSGGSNARSLTSLCAGHDSDENTYKQGITVRFELKIDGVTHVVEDSRPDLIWFWGDGIVHLYYPSVNVTAAYVCIHEESAKTWYKVDMKPHALLNGSYWFDDWASLTESGNEIDEDDVPVVTNTPVDLSNKIYTSETNNPFFFPSTGIATVGSGEIYALCSAAKALSEGQFGQFPMYAFTSEGVWSLSVSSTGGYSAVQPVTRDVVLSADSITQLDATVMMATARGLMLLSGSSTQTISDHLLDDGFPPSLLSLPGGEQIVDYSGVTTESVTLIPFLDFVKNCRMVYDYVHQRLIVYNPNCGYAYVWSMDSKKWGMMESSIASHINAYPDAVSITSGGVVVNHCTTTPITTEKNGLVLTRALKLGQGDILKTLRSVLQRGEWAPNSGAVRCALWGSRDLRRWFLLWNSDDERMRYFSGTPWKYFKVAVMTRFTGQDGLQGMSIESKMRLTDQPR